MQIYMVKDLRSFFIFHDLRLHSSLKQRIPDKVELLIAIIKGSQILGNEHMKKQDFISSSIFNFADAN